MCALDRCRVETQSLTAAMHDQFLYSRLDRVTVLSETSTSDIAKSLTNDLAVVLGFLNRPWTGFAQEISKFLPSPPPLSLRQVFYNKAFSELIIPQTAVLDTWNRFDNLM